MIAQNGGASRAVPPHARNVCAILVSYQPDVELREQISGVMRQVAFLIVVDNASGTAAREELRRATDNPNMELILNAENRGVGAALNQGAERATRLGFKWVLTLDQDSWLDPSLVATLEGIYRAHPDREAVKILGVNYLHAYDRSPAFSWRDDGALFHEVRTVITSGSLLSLEAYRDVGPFREDFFIDQIDHEYCLRLRSHGYRVLISRRPLMVHSLGNQTRHKFLWKRPRSTNHRPLRWYYMARNRLVLHRMYFAREPRWVLNDLRAAAKDAILLILFEDRKLIKAAAMGLGVWHGCLRRMGKAHLGRRFES